MIKNKFVAGFEVLLVVASLFAFCYFVDLSEDAFPLASAAEDGEEDFQDWVDEVGGQTLIEDSTWNNYPISLFAQDAGCCFLGEDRQICGTATPDNCVSDSPFAEGALCAETSFCEKGCCYDESLGIYDKNVLEILCPSTWVDDPNCNMPRAGLGCCVLGTETIFETEGQCRVDTLARAIGDNAIVDWDGSVGEGECLFLASVQKEGACVLSGGRCNFISEAHCFSDGGDFNENYLCTSPSLNTSCNMTEQTSCIDGKDEVYFVDSCGNWGNVYDSDRMDDVDYWDRVVEYGDLCGAGEGNAESASCGNCNRFLGGICSSASADGFNVDAGDFYCKDTACMFDGEDYENGESWCVYDGAIGEGNDVVGSRHWKYVCSQGVVQVEPCADYRNQICIQSDSFEVRGETVDFNNAACVANNWRECINLNTGGMTASDVASNKACISSNSKNCHNRTLYPSDSDKMNCVESAANGCAEDGDYMSDCRAALNCRVESVDIADKFKFDVCLPEYPGGFSLNDERYQMTAERLCGMADQTCTFVQKPKKWGGCKDVANADCLDKEFAQEMNDFCRGLGDCGGSVNILGDWSGNYRVKESPWLSDSWIAKLVDYANPVEGQFAEVEDYSEYLEAAGVAPVTHVSGSVSGGDKLEEMLDYDMLGMGFSGLGVAGAWAAGKMIAAGYGVTTMTITSSVSGTATSTSAVSGFTASASALSGAAIGAGIGMVAGQMLANHLGLSPGGSMLMAVGGAMVGAALGYAVMMGSLMALGPVGWAILIVGVVLMIIATFFGGSDCPPIDVEFECKPWQPIAGGDKCEECNGNLLKPCSKYRCESLGAGCELINPGTGDELCVSGNPNDVTPPVIIRQNGITFEGGGYEDSDEGFSVVGVGGGCLEAYTPLVFGVMTNEPAQCRFDFDPAKEFDEMQFDLGGNSYLYNHTTLFPLPDPSHGESQGLDWNGELTLYIKCRDRYGIVSPGAYRVDMCVNQGPDKTAPKIVASEPENGGLVGFDTVSQGVLIVTNELSTCKWDLNDVGYSAMNNDLVCLDSLGSPSNPLGYVCTAILPVVNSSDYYIRCTDQPWLNESSERNPNTESFVFSLRKPDKKISIDKIKPDSDFVISTDFTTIDLKVATSGGGNYHFCSYSFSGYDSMIEMFETGNERTHSQTLNRRPGGQVIYVECRDEIGEFVRNVTQFHIFRDSSSPQVARIWQSGGFMNLVLIERGECRFDYDSCGFSWDDGFEIGSGYELRFPVIRGQKYYIRCADNFGNAPRGCSVEVMAL